MEPEISSPKHLHILMAASVPGRREGGVAAVIYNLGRELESRGHKVTYIFEEDLIPRGSASQRFRELTFARRLGRYIASNREKYSVVNLHAPAGFAYGLRKRWGRHGVYPPYVMTLHGLEERRVHVMKREARKGRAWNFSWKNRLWHHVYHFPRFRWSIRTADGAHVFSRDVWTMLQLKYDLDSDRVAYITNAAERRFFIAREYRGGDAIRLLYPGTWLDQRGIFYIREALQKVNKQFPRVSLTVAGGGIATEEILRFFGSELADIIVSVPVVPADKMPQLYAEHDVLVFPSLLEGLPTVLLEAMATGMPVITTETCGMTDVVEKDVNGLLVPPADSEALENAIAKMVTSQVLRETLGRAARETMKRYSWERSAGELESFFYRIIDANIRRASHNSGSD